MTDYCRALTAGLNFALVELTESKNGAKVVSELSGYCREESLQLEDKNVYITSKFTITKTEILKKQKQIESTKIKRILKMFCYLNDLYRFNTISNVSKKNIYLDIPLNSSSHLLLMDKAAKEGHIKNIFL